MKNIEEILQQNAIYSPKKFVTSDISSIINPDDLRQIGMGMMSRVYKVKRKDWVVKEGRWDLHLDVAGTNAKIPFPIETAERLLDNTFSLTFLPKEEEILRQYDLYLKFAKYFGYFSPEENYYHPKKEQLFKQQQKVRNSLVDYIPEIQKKYLFKINKKITKVLTSEEAFHNFLPKEYLLAGKSICPQNKGKVTYYIFQEYVTGDLLHDVKYKDLPKKDLYQLIVLIYLIILMESQIGILPDTRPRHPFEVYNWLTKTDNIIKDESGMKYIDTRWFWDSRSNIAKRGVLLPNFIKTLAAFYINYLLKFV